MFTLLKLANEDFSLAVSDFKTKDVALRFKTDGHVFFESIVEN